MLPVIRRANEVSDEVSGLWVDGRDSGRIGRKQEALVVVRDEPSTQLGVEAVGEVLEVPPNDSL
jgi:hypothetical protein